MTEEKDKNNDTSVNNENSENIKKLQNLLSSDKSDLYEILDLKKKVQFHNKTDEDKINNDIWLKQYFQIFPPNDPTKLTKPKVNQLNLLLSSAEKDNIKDTNKINKIKFLRDQGNNYIKEISKIKTLLQLNIYKSNMEKINIDLNEYLIQREMIIRTKKEEPEIKSLQSKTQDNNATSISTKDVSNKPRHKRKTYKKKEDSYEADFIHDEEDSENSEIVKQLMEKNKKEGSSFKRYADALQKEAENFANSRSRRNINKKRDDDFVYEDDLKNEGFEKDQGLDIDIIEEKNESNVPTKRKKKINEGDEEYSEDSFEKKEKKKFLNKKVKREKSNIIEEENNNSTKILPLNSDKETKMNSRKRALDNITDILKDNKYLMAEGLDFVKALAERVEEDLAKAYPEIDFDYQKTLSNMTRTLKEISNYKRINQLIIKGKLILFKMAKFNYGEKFIQKLKKIEEGSQSKKPPNKPALKLDSLEKEKDKLVLKQTVSGISYKSAFSQNSITEEINNYNDNNYNNTNDSGESIEEQGNIKFSPGGNNRTSADMPGNLEEAMGHTYDPFNLEKIDSKNILFPILYDPSLPPEEDEITEENISNNNDNEENNNNIIISEPPPKGSVLRIYHGKIKLNHNTIDKVSLYSFNKYENFLKFPAFEKELILPSKAKSNEVIPYCLKQLNNSSKLELFGWIEPEPNIIQENVELSKFSELIEEFERNEKCSCLVDNKIKLYIFTLGEKDEKLYKKIIKKNKFVNKRFMEALNSGNKFLVFVLLANYDDFENEAIKKKKKMNPEIINRLDESESEEEDEYINTKKNKNLSIVMEEEENIPSSSFKKNNENMNEENDDKEENNDGDDEESNIDKEENDKLKSILEQNDFNAITEYIENNFKDLPLEEMANKLQKFSAENREKLLNIIKSYSERFSGNDNQMDVEEDNNINNINQNQQMNSNDMMSQMNNINPNYGINMYQNDPNINQMYLSGINNYNIPQQQNNNNNGNINPNFQQMYYNQGMNIYNNYNQNFK